MMFAPGDLVHGHALGTVLFPQHPCALPTRGQRSILQPRQVGIVIALERAAYVVLAPEGIGWCWGDYLLPLGAEGARP